jgi:hypothetical protein
MKHDGKHTQFLDALKAGGLDYSSETKSKIVDLGDENSVPAIDKVLEKAVLGHEDDLWIVNLTGGTKPMSIGAYEFSKRKGLKTFYISEGNQKEAIDLLSGSSTRLDHRVTTAEFLAGYGFEIVNSKHSSPEKSQEWASPLTNLAAEISKHNDDSGLRGLLARLQTLKEAQILLNKNEWEKNGIVISEEDEVFLKNDELKKMIASHFGLSTSGSNFVGRLGKADVEFLTGRWLEVFVWSLLKPMEGIGIWDLHLGALVGKGGDGENNDLDVSFMRNHSNQSLCIVECKTGGKGHDPEANNILYKIEAIKSGPRALKVATFLATTSDNIIDEKTAQIKESLKRRAEIYGCKIIPGKRIKELAELYLDSDPSLSDIVAKKFGIKKELGVTKEVS